MARVAEEEQQAEETPAEGGGAARRTLVVLALGLILAGVVLLAPLHGASPWAHRVMAIITLALVLWIGEGLNIAVTSLLVVGLLAMFGPGGSSKATQSALYGFQLGAPYFLLGTLVIAAATVKSGLAARLARLLVAGTGGSTRRLYAQLVLFIPPFAIAVPSATTRNAILVPAYEHVMRRYGIQRGDTLARLVGLGLGLLQVIGSTAVLTGGVAPITTAFLLGGMSWGQWFVYMAVPNYAIILGAGTLFYLWQRPAPRVRAAPEFEAAREGPWTPAEIRAALIIGTMTLLWLGDFLTGWDPVIPALIGAVALLAPGIGVLDWHEFELSSPWGIFFVTASSLSIAHALETSGAAGWLATQLVGHVPLQDLSLWLLLLVMIAVVLVVNVVLPNRSGALGILIPLLTSVALRVHLNPLPVGLLVGIMVQTTTFYPVQNAAALIVYRTRLFAPFDFLRGGLIVFAVSVAAVFLVALPWWSLIGIPIR